MIIKIFSRQEVSDEYTKIYYDFKDELKAGEPPYINLIYARYVMMRGNKILRKGGPFAYQHMLVLMSWLKFKFNFFPDMEFLWSLASRFAEPQNKMSSTKTMLEIQSK